MKKKLSLSSIKVKSFITTLDSQKTIRIKGGSNANTCITNRNSECESMNCNPGETIAECTLATNEGGRCTDNNQSEAETCPVKPD